MKVFEILNRDIPTITESDLINKLKHFNWKYEFSENYIVQLKGKREMELLENQIYGLWKKNPDLAIKLWNEHYPGAQKDSVPTFIWRLQLQDETTN